MAKLTTKDLHEHNIVDKDDKDYMKSKVLEICNLLGKETTLPKHAIIVLIGTVVRAVRDNYGD